MASRRRGKGDAGSALRRQWLVLKLLADARTGTTVAQIKERLADEGYTPSTRTLERDLAELRDLFPLHAKGRHPQTWFFDREARIQIPSLTADEALSLTLVQERLGPLLPGITREHLRGHFEAARKVLAREDGRKLARWSQRVVAVPTGQPRLPAKVSTAVRDAVYEALLGGHQLRLNYRARHGGRSEHQLHPLGLAVRETVIYLVATHDGRDKPFLYALHRARSAEVIHLPARWPPGFDLRRYIEQEIDWPLTEGHIALDLRIVEDVLAGLEENPLAADQVIEPDDEGWFRLRASVRDTRLLRSFLFGYGATLEVLGPPHLRAWVEEELAKTRARYAPRRARGGGRR
ncbi:MAG: helix-turn-helix transcriptional regulator [Myxococcales bacterium]|jgi:predicted DNA-binding transcriptional regulator YafY